MGGAREGFCGKGREVWEAIEHITLAIRAGGIRNSFRGKLLERP